MKSLKIIGLAILFWAISLIWPDINLALTHSLMFKLILGLGGIYLILDIVSYFGRDHDNHHRTPLQETRDLPEVSTANHKQSERINHSKSLSAT